MAVWRFVDFCVPEAQRLADLSGVMADLRAVESLCRRLRDLGTPDSIERSELAEALCSASLVKYGRTFASGVRIGTTDAHRRALTPEQLEWHQYFKDLRDKWVAHSVNSFEENAVVAYLVPPERGTREVSSVVVHSTRVSSLTKVAIDALLDLSVSMQNIVSQEIEEERSRVLAFARSLPVEPLYASDVQLPQLPNSFDPGKRRRKFGDA